MYATAPSEQLVSFVAKLHLVSLVCALSVAGAAADTGPEYLEGNKIQDPMAAAFKVLKLPFAEEQHSLLHLRSFYLERDLDSSIDGYEWAGGGWLNLVTDFWDDRLKLGATGYTSQKLMDSDQRLGIGLLQPDGDSYSVLGELYASFNTEHVALQAGRYLVNLPYINESDTRMTPNTFQGAQVVIKIGDQWNVGGGILTDIKRKTSTDFESLYKAAGLQGDEDVKVLAALYENGAGTTAGAYYMHAPEYIDGAYLEINQRFALGDDRYIQFSGQYTWQEPVGGELAGDIDAKHYGLRATWGHGWYSGSLAWTDYPDENRIRSPWGSIPGYTSVMIRDFNRPEEQAWLLGGTIDLSNWVVHGFKVNAKYTQGDTPDCGKSASPDQSEWDLNLDYSPPHSSLAGLDLRLRFGWVDQDDTCGRRDGVDIADVRFILNYAFDL